MGNGGDWIATAHARQWSVEMVPQVGKFVSFSARFIGNAYGHVAIVSAIESATSFTVLETNWKYPATAQPGRIDCRKVASLNGVVGFSAPQGITLGNSPASLASIDINPLKPVADAITQVGLQATAGIRNAEAKAAAMAQIGTGLTVMGGGALFVTLSTIGSGNAAQGAETIVQTATPAAQRYVGRAEGAWHPKIGRNGTIANMR
jgi:surface antigen